MNLEKTGSLIAKRRRELGLTQKALADQLNISDRTVSKWERGLGFPDISLIEPLADALNIAVVDLLHGEENTAAEAAESSAKEIIQTFCPQIKAQRRHSRKKLCIVITLLSVVVALLIASFAISIKDIIGDETGIISIDAAEATEICPYILINRQDTDLLNALMQDQRIRENLDKQKLFTYGSDIINHYYDMIDSYDLKLTYVIIQSSFQLIHVEYGTELTRIYLEIDQDGAISKGIMQLDSPLVFLEDGTFDFSTTPDARYAVYNVDNRFFERKTYETGFAAIF